MTSILRRATGAMIVAWALVLLPFGTPRAAEQYDQAKLELFVTAALAVNKLVEQWTPRIQGAQNETEASQLREQANGELVAAIQQSNGISIEEYRQISQAAQTRPGPDGPDFADLRQDASAEPGRAGGAGADPVAIASPAGGRDQLAMVVPRPAAIALR